MAQSKNIPVAEALIKAGAIVNALDKVNSLMIMCCSCFDKIVFVSSFDKTSLTYMRIHTYALVNQKLSTDCIPTYVKIMPASIF